MRTDLKGWFELVIKATTVFLVVFFSSKFAVSALIHSNTGSGSSNLDRIHIPEMVLVPKGKVALTDDINQKIHALNENELQNTIVFDHPFLIGKYEVTFAQWDKCHDSGGCSHYPNDYGWGRGNRPVVDVSWQDITEYVRWLSAETGRNYRLPSELEWEYAARAGSPEPIEPPPLFTDEKLAWASSYVIEPRASRKTKPIGSNGSNDFGLFDIKGNVWEWTQSCWRSGTDKQGSRFDNCGIRVIRGEHRTYMPDFLREIGTGGCSVKPMPGNFGFRLLLEG